jgi:predicted DNA-binding protein
MEIKSKNLTISMPSDLFVSLEKSASALDRSKNYLVRKSLEVFLVNIEWLFLIRQASKARNPSYTQKGPF